MPSSRRLALAATAVLLALIQLAGSNAAVTATPDQIGQWSAPVAWPLVRSTCRFSPTGRCLMLDGFDNA